MTYLVDANVLCEPTKPAPDSGAVAWLTAHEGDFVVDPIILGEVQAGILGLPRGRKRTQLEHWFDAVGRTVECLPWDAAAGRRWAKLVVDMKGRGQSLPVLDSLIAATALTHGLTVVTRNVRDFAKTGVNLLNPFQADGPGA